MFAQLGGIVFQVVGPLTGLEARRVYGYAQHRRAAGKPRLQHTGDELEDVTLDLAFHASFCVPSTAVAELYTLAEAHEAVPLFFATGEVRGRFVVEEVTQTIQETDASGQLVHAVCRVRLLEWPEALLDLAAAGSLQLQQQAEATLPDALATAVKGRVLVAATAAKETVPIAAITRWGS